MVQEPQWLREDVVLAIHRRQIAEHGGMDGIRDKALLESALNKPRNLYMYESPAPSITTIAASYAYGIIKNHPFIDGNKRTAFVICLVFLELNGYTLQATGRDKYETIIRLASGTIQEAEFAKWLEKKIMINAR